MTEQEFLEKVTYNTNEKSICIWYGNSILSTLSFEGVEDKLDDDEYCSNLAEEVALQSSLAENLIQ